MADDGICSIEHCGNPAETRGWCARHYCRWKRHGDPLVVKKRWRSSSEPMPATRSCTICLKVKALSEFSVSRRSGTGVRERCKECSNTENARYRAAHRENEAQRSRRYAAAHREEGRERLRQWRLKNPEKYRQTAADWRKKNSDSVHATASRSAAKRLSTPIGRLHNAVRACVNQSIRIGSKARRRTVDLLGYSFEDLKCHLERQFVGGMSWANYGRGGWHIDHIIPLSSFGIESPDDPAFRACWALSNLRPLWESDNREKHAKRLHLL